MAAEPTIEHSATPELVRDNWVLVQLVGLAPLLAVSTSVVKGLALGVATVLVLVATSALGSLLSLTLLPRARMAIYVAIAAILVTALDWIVYASFYRLHGALGIFLPLIVANAGLFAEGERVAKEPATPIAVARSLKAGLGFLAVLMALGALRELVGAGTLLADLELIGLTPLDLQLPFNGMQIASLPPGAFLGVALLLALRNHLLARRMPPPGP